MTLQVSTGFKQAILGPSSFTSIFNGGCIRVFDGTQPPTADMTEGGAPLLGVISLNGAQWNLQHLQNGLTFTQSGPYITKFPWDHWLLNVTTGGYTARWFRIIGPTGDDGSTSYVFPRIDGAIFPDTSANPEMVLPNITPALGTLVSLDTFIYTIPPLIGV